MFEDNPENIAGIVLEDTKKYKFIETRRYFSIANIDIVRGYLMGEEDE